MVSHTQILGGRGGETHELGAERHIYLISQTNKETEKIRTMLDPDRQHAGMPHQRTAAPSRWRKSPPS